MMRLVTLVFDRECFVVKEKVQGLTNIDKSINPTISSIFARYSCRKYTDKEVANEISQIKEIVYTQASIQPCDIKIIEKA